MRRRRKGGCDAAHAMVFASSRCPDAMSEQIVVEVQDFDAAGGTRFKCLACSASTARW